MTARSFRFFTRRHRVVVLAGTAAAALMVSLTPGAAIAADPPAYKKPRPAVQAVPSVDGTTPSAVAPPEDPAAEAAARPRPAAAWPKPGKARLELGRSGPAPRAGGLAARATASKADPAGGAPTAVDLEVLPQDAARRAGMSGVLISVGRADGGTSAAPVRVDLDYSSFAKGVGGDYASRLRLEKMPDCVLTTPEVPACQQGTAVESTNDWGRQTVSGELLASSSMTTYAMTAGTSGSAGNYGATPLSPASAWQVSNQTGDFSWSYPFRVPPAVGGPSPSLTMSYSSGSVDGRTASTNNQPSWVGEGHSLESGYVERKYVPCADDMTGGNNTVRTGDLCWKSDNASVVLGGQSGELVKDSVTGQWRLKDDEGSRMERLTGASNGDNDREHWRLTMVDGTQYYFGRGLRGTGDTGGNTESTWTVPVFGNHVGEPCRATTFAASSCSQAWRWNLDHVVDPSGNTMTYYYTPETNNYGRNNGQAVSTYTRGGVVNRIEYGERLGSEHTTAAPSVVRFATAERCLPSASTTCDPAQLTAATASSWPDVPFDQICANATSCTQRSPSFFSRKRLTSVTTQVWGGSAYSDVDTWSLQQTFPSPGDGTTAGLWLAGITHTGKVGGTAAMPALTFAGTQLANRVDGLDMAPPLIKWRVSSVNSETGGTTSVNYLAPECVAGSNVPAAPESNGKRCFPVFYTPEGQSQPTIHYFHKHVVASIVESDRTAAGTSMPTYYEYVGSPAWHFDDNEFTLPKYRTYGQYRGYQTVKVRQGAAGPTQSLSVYTYMRGMDDDLLPGGGRRDVKVPDSQGGVLEDHPRLNGFLRESITYDGASGPEVSGSVSTPWISAPTANDGSKQALLTATAVVDGRTALSSGAVRRTRSSSTLDAFGMPVEEFDAGDLATTADDRCTRNEYARNTAAWLINEIVRTEVVAVGCTTTPTRPAHVVSDQRFFFDGATVHTGAPTRALVTKTEALSAWGTAPVYQQKSRFVYDSHGRALEAYDGLNRKTSTAYTPATGGPVTKVTTTNAKGFTSTQHLSAAWGSVLAEDDPNLRRTDLSYDPLGRLTQVWLPGRAKATATPHMRFTYNVRNTGPVSVRAEELQANGAYSSSVALYDGLLRLRQTQDSAPGGGRLLTENSYDSRGLLAKASGPTYNAAAPGTELLLVADNQTPSQTRTTFDGVGRPTAQAFLVNAAEKWRTTTAYGGDRVTVDPPEGDTPTTTVLDAYGRTTEMHQYKASSPTGAADVTRYGYRADDQQATVRDQAGNSWNYSYDLQGRQTASTEPDRGRVTNTYDAAGQLTTTTDARAEKLAYTYDVLGRVDSVRDDSPTGALRTSWTYDTLAKGKPTSSTRHVGASAYTTGVKGYDPLYRPTGGTTTVPASEGALAGTYSTSLAYNVDGSVRLLALPTVPGLPAETLRLSYNELGMPKALTGSGAYVADTLYSPYGQTLQTATGNTLGKGAWQTSTFEEGTGRLTSMTVDRENVPQTDGLLRYGYDQAGNVTSISDTPTNAAAEMQCLRYDYLRRITDAWTPTNGCGVAPTVAALGGPAPYWQSFGYDSTGNRTSQVKHAAAGNTTEAYAHPAPGQPQPHTLRTVTTTGPAGMSTSSYGYDKSGSTTSRALAGKPGQALTWDAEGKLATATVGTATTSYLYSAEGDRLIEREPGATTLYLDHGTELRLDKATGAVSSTRHYAHGGATVAVRTAAGVSTLVADHHGTAEFAIDNASTAVTRRRMSPFGEDRGLKPTWPGDRGFVGGNKDATGLTHVGAREYDPATGRFVSADPIINHFNPQQMNGYAYASNNPSTWSDPTGLYLYEGSTTPGDEGQKVAGKNGTTISNGQPAKGTGGKGKNASAGKKNGSQGGDEKRIANQQKRKAQAAVKKTAGELIDLVADVLGYGDALDCLRTGKGCGAAIVTIIGEVVLAAVGGLVLKYGWKIKKIIQIGDRLRELGSKLIGELQGLRKASKRAAETGGAGAAKAEQFVYRVHGGDSGPMGHSWTPENPMGLSNPRGELGLPKVNSGQQLTRARVTDMEGVMKRDALPLDGNPGGAPEWLFPDPLSQLDVHWTIPLVPPW